MLSLYLEDAMPLNAIKDIIDDIRQGKPVIIMDDENRENEGDLIIAAEKITPEVVNFMVREARGLLCLALSSERCDYLGLPPMVATNNNQSCYGTPFTVSIEAAKNVTTGISAQDRAHTISVAIDAKSTPADIVQPGHIFPLRAQDGGVLTRAGHTEAGCDLTRLAGLKPGAAIIEIMNEDGTMSRRPELETFAAKHGLKIGTIADLIHYRMTHEKTVVRQKREMLDTKFGSFAMTTYSDTISSSQYIALSKGNIHPETPCMVRVHRVEPLQDLLGAINNVADPDWSLHQAMQAVENADTGVIVLLASMFQSSDLLAELSQTRGNNFSHNIDTSHALAKSVQVLKDLDVGKVRLLGSPEGWPAALSNLDLDVVENIRSPYEFI
ncbi:MAG: 3,4-dihydroxy-2-butanone-4-phosphate synthase [Endozoicomonas sp. (ex Botrylloides leachii)]|nr:3,4-dihydroxy-2-butanone-4-phosphate synthase [Endozoicomonas sp. (ex Botrylloides leachii)]